MCQDGGAAAGQNYARKGSVVTYLLNTNFIFFKNYLYDFPIKYCQLGFGSEIHSSP